MRTDEEQLTDQSTEKGKTRGDRNAICSCTDLMRSDSRFVQGLSDVWLRCSCCEAKTDFIKKKPGNEDMANMCVPLAD